ncbi:copper amine oxidase [Mycena floridula]|nr:copper amine oxidase [Mycena floridula]
MTTVPGTATGVQSTVHHLPTGFKHPLDPLTPDEIAAVTLSTRHYVAAKTDVKAIKFITCYLLPAPKKAVLAFLGIPLAPGAKPEPPVAIVRKAEVDKWHVETFEKLPEGVQPQISVEELVACEQVVRNDKRVQQLAKDVGVLPHQIFCDGWSIGYDDRFPQKRRVQQALVFARFSEHDNLYAHPMSFIETFPRTLCRLSIANEDIVLHIDFPPHYKASPSGTVLSTKGGGLPDLSEDSFERSNRDRIPPPRKAFDFLPDLLATTEPNFKPRDDIKPIHVVQPEGVSFKMNGNELEWQNWKMHIAFSHREGIALSTVTYNDHGELRPILYRLSLAEMVVPYAAPEHPHPRKFAFDVGEYGMGTMANELTLGCDCVGQIHYLPGSFVAHDGSAIVIKNVICIHEEDSGVLWKHTDYRPGGRSQSVRRRRLVVSMVCTLANYEYIWNYHFYQDGSIELEIRLTGILQVYVSADGEASEFGTMVAPNVNAHYHQHIFSIRVDPMVDGLHNTVVESDIIPLDAPTGSESNFAGNAFASKETERRWKIVNSGRQHYSSGSDVGYVLGLKGGITPVMARSDGWAMKRASFTKYPLWVCRDEEGDKGGRMWPSGKYVPQTRESPDDSVSKWVEGKKNITNEDLVLFLTVGTTHIPRPEDWPVMPVEHLSVTFKPQSFFEKNPSMDVPGTRDPHSVAAFGGESISEGSHVSCH